MYIFAPLAKGMKKVANRMEIDLNNLTIKDEYTLGHDKKIISSGLKKLTALFLEIGKIQNPVDTDK